MNSILNEFIYYCEHFSWSVCMFVFDDYGNDDDDDDDFTGDELL